MLAVRWLSFENNPLTNPQQQLVAVEEALRFEKSPHREVSVELLNPKEGTFNDYRRVGLVVDQTRTIFRRGYYEDGYTELQADGVTLRSALYDEDKCKRVVDIAFTWDEAEQMLHHLDPDRELWAEGVVWKPYYSALSVLKGAEVTKEFLEKLKNFFGIHKVIKIKSALITD